MSATDGEIQTLRQKVEETEVALQKAAQYGLQLLDDKMDLQNKLEEQRIEMTAVIEVLEQEKYSLQREVELKGRMLDSLHSEFDYVKNQQKHLLEQQQTMLERNHAVELCDFKSKVEKIKADLDEARLLEKQMRHKLELQSQTLSCKTEELRKLMECSHDTRSSEIAELQMKKMDLESSVTTLKRELQESDYKGQQLQLTVTIIQRQLEAMTSLKEEKDKEVESLYNALEKSREANQDLQIQLEQALQQMQDPNSKGNSLFSEVEDRRVEMERQLISVKVQYQSLQKQHAFTKQQMLRMKVQISNLMQLQGVRADPAQLERLQFMLSEKNSEIETLMRKVQQLEKVEMTLEDQSSTGTSKPNEFVDETYYTDLLKMQLSSSKKVAETLKDELSMARLKALSESHRVLELERKLFGAENALKQGQSDNIKLQVKLEELQMKYEPEAVNRARAQKRKREKFPANPPEERSDHCTMETPATDNNPVKIPDMTAETPPCSTKNPPAKAQAPDCSSVLLDGSKCVRICEDTQISLPEPPKSSVADCSSMAEQQILKCDEEQENWRAVERKYHMPVHVDPENTMERQCAQQ
ncbi:protein Spindly isoform X1 [Pygocentrus nattereri]|uniref:protein Spindly isoform X1 n=1 Tax=Pygocentrus nattereri TaxID=42514 RepID=UPI0008142C6F|nr:protein Spindly isoform X1 [Pygocentrus nattereri]